MLWIWVGAFISKVFPITHLSYDYKWVAVISTSYIHVCKCAISTKDNYEATLTALEETRYGINDETLRSVTFMWGHLVRYWTSWQALSRSTPLPYTFPLVVCMNPTFTKIVKPKATEMYSEITAKGPSYLPPFWCMYWPRYMHARDKVGNLVSPINIGFQVTFWAGH